MNAKNISLVTLVVITIGMVFSCTTGEGNKDFCVDFCSQLRECSPEVFDATFSSESQCIGECDTQYEVDKLTYSEACYTARVALISCTSQLSCVELEEYETGDPQGTAEYPCKSEAVTFLEACNY